MATNPTIPRWRAALGALLAIALAAGVAGCAGNNSGIQAGERVDVYVSMPLHGPEAGNGRDVVDGAHLALTDAHGKVGELAVRATYLDDTAGGESNASWSAAAGAANARKATQDSAAIAYIGDFSSGATRFSLPITNEAHLLQVSPAASAVDLVQPYLGAGDQVPDDVQPTGDRTFGRVVPSDEAQARAGAIWAKRLGVKGSGVGRDDSSFGRTVAAAFTEQARAVHISAHAITGRRALFVQPPSGASVACAPSVVGSFLYYAGERTPVGLAGSCSPDIQYPRGVMATDALMTATSLRELRALPELRLTSAAENPSQLPPAGQRFLREFRKRYGREPGPYAAYGYEAMGVVLDSIRRAGDSGDDRDSVVDAFFDTTDRDSVLGTYSIADVGNTTLDRLAGYRVVNGNARFETALHVTP